MGDATPADPCFAVGMTRSRLTYIAVTATCAVSALLFGASWST